MGIYSCVIVLINLLQSYINTHDYYYPFKWYPLSTSPASPGRNLTFTRGFKCVQQQLPTVKKLFPRWTFKNFGQKISYYIVVLFSFYIELSSVTSHSSRPAAAAALQVAAATGSTGGGGGGGLGRRRQSTVVAAGALGPLALHNPMYTSERALPLLRADPRHS